MTLQSREYQESASPVGMIFFRRAQLNTQRQMLFGWEDGSVQHLKRVGEMFTNLQHQGQKTGQLSRVSHTTLSLHWDERKEVGVSEFKPSGHEANLSERRQGAHTSKRKCSQIEIPRAEFVVVVLSPWCRHCRTQLPNREPFKAKG